MVRRLAHVVLLAGCGEEAAVPAPPLPAAPLPPCDALAAVSSRTPVGVTAAERSSCAWFNDGSVECWGENLWGHMAIDSGGLLYSPRKSGFQCAVEFTVTYDVACSARADGRVECAGRNDDGQLGNGTFAASSSPVAVLGIHDAVAARPDGIQACALTATGDVLCWGYGWGGDAPSAGVGLSDSDSPLAVRVDLAEPVVEIAVGGHVCARTQGGVVWCWGRNGAAQLGDGTTEERLEPVRAIPDWKFQRIFVGGGATCGIDAAGQLWCWGSNMYGQLGHTDLDQPSFDAFEAEPVRVEGIVNPLDVEIVGLHGFAALPDGSVWSWGHDPLWEGYPDAQIKGPRQFPGYEAVTDVAISGGHYCALTKQGRVFCAGTNNSGELGQGATVIPGSDVPLEVFFDR